MKPFNAPNRADERDFERELFAKYGVARQVPQREEVWVGSCPDTEGVRLAVIEVYDDRPVPFAYVFSNQLGLGLVRLAVFGRYFERCP